MDHQLDHAPNHPEQGGSNELGLTRPHEPELHAGLERTLHEVTDLGADLVPGVWGIEEPDPARCRRVALSEVDFALVPALSCSSGGVRLGYGAGYFDRLLAGAGTRTFRVVALPEALAREQVPSEPHDVPVDALLTERRFLKTKTSP